MSDIELINTSFELAAERHGDITEVVYQKLFGAHPDSEQYFLLKGEQFKQELKMQMVRDSIYAFFEYMETPEEVEISFNYTIPQHQDLGIPLEHVTALLQAVADVCCDCVAEEQRELTGKSWSSLMEKFTAMINSYM